MDHEQLDDLLKKMLAEYRMIPYKDLVDWVEGRKIETATVKDQAGRGYQVELQAFWDDKTSKDIRFSAALDPGEPRKRWKIWHKNLVESFIKSPDDTFVGE